MLRTLEIGAWNGWHDLPMKNGGELMKDNLKPKDKSPSSVKVRPVPEFITCPKCGGEIELWSYESLTVCLFCGHQVFKKENFLH
jgi:hypothetical protein